MRHEDTQAAANWSILLGGVLLFVSLFLTWSKQRETLPGVPVAPDAWQVYSAADILLCLLAVTLGWCAVTGRPAVRWVGVALIAGALAFVAHAVAAPPTNGAVLGIGGRDGEPSSGTGEILALVGLGLALAGLTVGEFGRLAGHRRPNVQELRS